jgi:hypothetical protein
MRVMTMRRLGRSVNADVIIINGITTGNRVIMGDCKFRDCRGGWDINNVTLGHTTVSGFMAKLSLILLRLCVWFCGDIRVEILQVKGVQ